MTTRLAAEERNAGRRARRRAAALVLGILALAHPTSALPNAESRVLRGAEEELRAAQVEAAAERLAPLLTRHPRDPSVLRAKALLRFHQGDYAVAAEAMEASLQRRPARDDDDRPALLELMRSTRDATSGYEASRSDDGRYVILHPPGRDERLVPYALEALERADQALQEELGLRVPGPIRLEIYPNARTLASVSSLTEEAIERTGTIALCKWDRLMVTSPRALLRGYPWMDTISHELVHLVLARASRDQAPVWLQEGVAKFLEQRWREGRAHAHLRPSVAALLARRVREDRLLSFDQIHPSIALLPSQEDAALAFAQVSTFVERYYQQHGREGLQAAIARIARGEDARDALAAEAGVAWERLEREWRQSLRSRAAPEDAPRLLGLRFADGDEESDEVPEEARSALRLGDLMWARRRYGAAAIEYERALTAAPDDPLLGSRLGRAALASGDAERAVEALEPVSERYPEHAPTWAVLAAALRASGEPREARDAAVHAIRLNPFDPQPHCVLALVGADEAERALERGQCRSLGGTVPR